MENSTVENVCPLMDDSIIEYFEKNSHATVRKAASIFCVQTSYIDKLLDKTKTEFIEKMHKDTKIRRKKHCLNEAKVKEENSDSEDEMVDEMNDVMVIKDEFEFEECDVESMLENNSVIWNKAFKSEMQDVDICSKAGDTEEPFHLSSDSGNNKMPDNILCIDNMNGMENVAHCSKMKKCDTDDEVMCREMEYTKKRKMPKDTKDRRKKHSLNEAKVKKENGASEEEMVEEMNEVMVIKDEFEFEECDVESMLENNSVIWIKALQSEKQNVAICSKAGDTEEPFHLSSDSGNNKTPDNILCIDNMNRMEDAANCSKMKKCDTDNKVMCREMEYTKKRKKKCPKRSGTKKLKTSKRRKRTKNIQDPDTLILSRMLNSIVYTTRLEEMAILHKKKTYYDSNLINEILRESKPKYTAQKSNTNVRRTMSFKLLQKKINNFNKNKKLIGVTNRIGITSNYDEIIINGVIYPKKITTHYTLDNKTVGVVSNKCNVVIVINNLFSNLCDIYIIDSKSNVIEYHCNKLNDNNTINKFNHTIGRRILVLDVCCWFRRQHSVESLWPRNECNFFRFLITTHKCLTDYCTCCCKPKERTIGVTIDKPLDANVITHDLNTTLNVYNKSLIFAALRYNMPDTNENIYSYINQKNSSHKSFTFTETSRKGNIQLMKNECFEIGSNQEILRYHADTDWRESPHWCNQCVNIAGHRTGNQYINLTVCCKWRRDAMLYAHYKKCNISANTLRFLQKNLFPLVCDVCYNNSSPKTNHKSNLVVDMSKIEHTRTFVKPMFLKIGYKGTPSLNNNRVKNIPHQKGKSIKALNGELRDKTAHIRSTLKETKLPATVKLQVTSNKSRILGFVINHVDYQIATNIVTKLVNIKFTVEEDLKVVASLNTPMHTTSPEEFKILAQILLNTQNCLKLAPLPIESVIHLVAKIIIPSGFENNIQRQKFLKPFVNVNRESDVVSDGGHEHNDDKRPAFNTCDNIDETSQLKHFNHNETIKIFKHKVNNTNLLKNRNVKHGDVDIVKIIEDSCSKQNTANILKCSEQSSLKNSKKKRKPGGKNSTKFCNDCVISTNRIVSVDDIYDTKYCSKLEPYDCFANVIGCIKKCYTKSLKSYLKNETETSIVLPKISSVFSLNSASQIETKTNEILPSTSKASPTLITSISYNDNIQNKINVLTPFGTQKIMIYDPIKIMAQVVRLSPNELAGRVDNALSTITLCTKEKVEPKTIRENNSDIAVLTRINETSDGNMASMRVALEPVQEHFIIPDIIDDIPLQTVVENNDVIVKTEEQKDNVVLVLDSD